MISKYLRKNKANASLVKREAIGDLQTDVKDRCNLTKSMQLCSRRGNDNVSNSNDMQKLVSETFVPRVPNSHSSNLLTVKQDDLSNMSLHDACIGNDHYFEKESSYRENNTRKGDYQIQYGQGVSSTVETICDSHYYFHTEEGKHISTPSSSSSIDSMQGQNVTIDKIQTPLLMTHSDVISEEYANTVQHPMLAEDQPTWADIFTVGNVSGGSMSSGSVDGIPQATLHTCKDIRPIKAKDCRYCENLDLQKDLDSLLSKECTHQQNECIVTDLSNCSQVEERRMMTNGKYNLMKTNTQHDTMYSFKDDYKRIVNNCPSNNYRTEEPDLADHVICKGNLAFSTHHTLDSKSYRASGSSDSMDKSQIETEHSRDCRNIRKCTDMSTNRVDVTKMMCHGNIDLPILGDADAREMLAQQFLDDFKTNYKATSHEHACLLGYSGVDTILLPRDKCERKALVKQFKYDFKI